MFRVPDLRSGLVWSISVCMLPASAAAGVTGGALVITCIGSVVSLVGTRILGARPEVSRFCLYMHVDACGVLVNAMCESLSDVTAVGS